MFPVTSQRQSLLLIGHGTRSPAGIQQFLNIAAKLAELAAPAPVEPAFLELAQPDIAAAVTRLAGRGAERIVVVPFLLAAADHVKEDIPAAVEAAVNGLANPRPTLLFAEHLGAHPNIIELSQLRYRAALEPLPPIPAAATCHLLVGRGTHDQSAIVEVQRFADLRTDSAAAQETRLAFLAMAKPTLAAELQRVATLPFQRIVVQPHLLFEGDLMTSIRAQVVAVAGQAPRQQWITTAALADPPGQPQMATNRLAEAALDRFVTSIRVVGRGRSG